MKYSFTGGESLQCGIAEAAKELGFAIGADCADVSIQISESTDDTLSVSLHGNAAEIRYGGGKSRFFRALAILTQWLRDGKTDETRTENPIFSFCGAMIDMSRNAVMNVQTIKAMMRKMALMGMNAFMLYTEDTYEIEGRPYFGYMRGRYTKDELRELDSYALTLGIELIPCIQMLGHLATHLRWGAAGKYRDTAQVLLVGEEETYKLIEDMVRTVSECFTTRRIHIGMDETHDLGLGKYLDKNGYSDRPDIYFEHLHRVTEIVCRYGLAPMMWSDMFFTSRKISGPYNVNFPLTEEAIARIPKEIQPVFWSYWPGGETYYRTNIEKHLRISENPMFAGGIWLWSSHCPIYSRSLDSTIPALDACRKSGVREILATVWHNGSECSLILSLAGMAWYADYAYRGMYDEQGVRECFRFACGEDYDDFMKTELPEHPEGGTVSTSRVLLFNDPMLGQIDRHMIRYECAPYYRNCTDVLNKISTAEFFTPAFDVIRRLSELLENKADFGIRLKAAYDAGDRTALASLAMECDMIIEKITSLRRAHRASWMKYNKPFGWEIHDIRYGGLITRFETTKDRILAYLAGETARLEELDEERLRFDGTPDEDPPFTNRFFHVYYPAIATPNIL